MQRPGQWALLTAAVLLAHLWLAAVAMPDSLGTGASSRPQRMEVAFVTELTPSVPPAVPPSVSPSVAPRPAARSALVSPPVVVPAPEPAASSPEAPAPPEPVTEPSPVLEAETRASPPLATGPDVLPPLAELAPTAPSPSVAPSESPSPEPAAFEWPPSTRLSYRLTGDFRGPVEGQAQVEWLRSGTRYQVHLDVSVGPSFAPLVSRRVSSEGEITAEGLRPQRFDEETSMVFRDTRRVQLRMTGDTVRLNNGAEVPRPPGLQDTASQFVQLTWLFTMQPERLRAGQVLTMPLVFPRRVQRWQYEVGESEVLNTPAGPVEAVHVRPRRDDAGDAQRSGDLVPEAWFAPSLQYLPVRIVIRQGDGNHVDLMIERLPQQAAPK